MIIYRENFIYLFLNLHSNYISVTRILLLLNIKYRISYRYASYKYISHRYASTGVYLIGVYLTGVHLTGIHLTDIHLIGVYLTDVHLIGIHLQACIYKRAFRRHTPYRHALLFSASKFPISKSLRAEIEF